MRTWCRSLAPLVGIILAVSGCGQSRTSETSTVQRSPGSVDTTIDSSSPTPDPTGRRIPPSWAGPLQQQETELVQMIEQGRLNEVRAQTERMAGTLDQVAADGERLSAAKRQELDGHLTAARRHLEELQDAAGAANAVRVQDVLPQLRSRIRTIEEVFALSAE